MVAPKLREYQQEAHFSLMEVAKRAQKKASASAASRAQAEEIAAERCLAVQPTGAGKTILVIAFMRSVWERWKWRGLVIVPSRELVEQTARSAENLLPGAKVGRIVDGREKVEGCDLVIATSASLHRKRLSRIAPNHFQLVVVDEAHHAAASTFTVILEHFSAARMILGMTATYLRGDGVSVASEKFFPSIVVYHTIGQLTNAGYLVPARGLYVKTGLSLDGMRVSRGNFDEGQLSQRVNIPERNNLAVDAWLQHARERQTVVFCVDVDHARDVAECFVSRGIRARAVWGAMPREARDACVRDYNEGRLQVLVNVKLLIEGWDAPETSAVLIARPATRAAQAVLGPQMIGRALRPAPQADKRDAIVIELRDKKLEAKKRGAEEPIELNPSLILSAYEGVSEKDVRESKGYLHESARLGRALWAWRERSRLLDDMLNIEAVKETFDVIERISTVSHYAWIPLGRTLYMGLAAGDFIEIVEETPNYFEVRAVEDAELSLVGQATTKRAALRIADAWLAQNGRVQYFMHRDKPWRDRHPSGAQVSKAHKLTGLPRDFLQQLKSGQVSDLIATAYALMTPPPEDFGFNSPVGQHQQQHHQAAIQPQPSSSTPAAFHTWQFRFKFA